MQPWDKPSQGVNPRHHTFSAGKCNVVAPKSVCDQNLAVFKWVCDYNLVVSKWISGHNIVVPKWVCDYKRSVSKSHHSLAHRPCSLALFSVTPGRWWWIIQGTYLFSAFLKIRWYIKPACQRVGHWAMGRAERDLVAAPGIHLASMLEVVPQLSNSLQRQLLWTSILSIWLPASVLSESWPWACISFGTSLTLHYWTRGWSMHPVLANCRRFLTWKYTEIVQWNRHALALPNSNHFASKLYV